MSFDRHFLLQSGVCAHTWVTFVISYAKNGLFKGWKFDLFQGRRSVSFQLKGGRWELLKAIDKGVDP